MSQSEPKSALYEVVDLKKMPQVVFMPLSAEIGGNGSKIGF